MPKTKNFLFDLQVIDAWDYKSKAVTYHSLTIDDLIGLTGAGLELEEEIMALSIGEEIYLGKFGSDEFYVTRVQ